MASRGVNKVILVGNVGKDPDTRHMPSGDSVVNLTLATSESNSQLRDLALVLAGYLLVDSGDADAVRQRVGGLAVEGHPLRNAAREALGLAQFKAGDANAALTTFEAILEDPVVSAELRNRAEIYSAQLIARGAQSAAAPAVDAAAPAGDAAAPAADSGTGD